jgi:hypothetical protein
MGKISNPAFKNTYWRIKILISTVGVIHIFIFYHGDYLFKILSSTMKHDPHDEKWMYMIVRTEHENFIDIY